MHCTISSSGCSSIQGIYDWLTGGSICLLYICIVPCLAVGVAVCKASVLDCLGGLDQPVGVAVCKASMIDWLGGPSALYICIVLYLAVSVAVYKASMLNCSILPYIYALYYISSRGSSSMQGIYAQLTSGVHLPSIYMHCTISSSGCSSIQGTYAWMTGGVHLPSIYMHCTISSSGCSSMQGIYAQLTGGSICLLYICIVLYLAVDVVVCKASMLNWLGVHLPSIYMHCTISSSGYSGKQGIYAWLPGGPSVFYICILLDLAVGVVVNKAFILD